MQSRRKLWRCLRPEGFMISPARVLPSTQRATTLCRSVEDYQKFIIRRFSRDRERDTLYTFRRCLGRLLPTTPCRILGMGIGFAPWAGGSRPPAFFCPNGGLPQSVAGLIEHQPPIYAARMSRGRSRGACPQCANVLLGPTGRAKCRTRPKGGAARVARVQHANRKGARQTWPTSNGHAAVVPAVAPGEKRRRAVLSVAARQAGSRPGRQAPRSPDRAPPDFCLQP